MKDLAILVTDKNMESALRGILTRHQAMRIRTPSYEIQLHPGHDGGARTSGPELISLLRSQFRYGLLILDWEGCGSGSDLPDALALEQSLDARLARTWGEGSKAIVIDPELDAWVWGADNLMKGLLDWKADQDIRQWLAASGFGFSEQGKPTRPKEVIEAVTRHLHQPRSSALYKRITSKVSLARCTDAAFIRLKTTLQAWFPEA